eukprot:CAMPEP_0194039652 /NCGR_PEP_ID=MMETSP0009_2-20130614/11757_1 /TAXON_ID=210454 /ORGANISM="Grammatophora oceanica, Strain CCMP 410" /LENGTH=1039 /DNA_ID=CAMNT_0038682559 /DNA_START=18 /DNA_END=3137 /DNA_ORIENTATION=-
MASVSYTPAPHEQAYYEALFQAADIARTGNIGGAEAVGFFTKSKLAVDTLKNIWTLADQPSNSFLDRRKFAVAIRLIQLSQNGVKANGAQLGAPPGVQLRPAFFEGVSGVSIPMPPPPGAAGPPPPQQQQQQQPAPPPTPQPQYGQPPQQPQQQAPPPAQGQYQPPSPRTPPMAPQQGGQPPVMSNALTAQDPYVMTPQEQARYEALFPQYESKGDGYVYGAEAVGLFSKSGIPQDQLGKIWNMADQPVDNRLDKLEFAIAMHLIVCVSKKNMPLPDALPFGLKTLKQQAAGPPAPEPAPAGFPDPGAMAGGPPPAMEQNNMGAPPPTMNGGLGGPPPLSQGPPPAMGGGTGGMGGGGPPPLSGAPQLQPAGGLSISDAFEGLDSSNAANTSFGIGNFPSGDSSSPRGFGGFGESAQSYGGLSASDMPPDIPTMGVTPQVETVQEEDGGIPAPAAMAPRQRMTTVMEPVEPPKTTRQLAQNYDMGDESTELAKLKATLQKLQAENISLKAQMGNMSEEEKDVQKEIAATVHEIGSLSNNLTTLRAQVLATKSRLLESTAELKAAQEKKGVIVDLITETGATKDALAQAAEDIGNSNAVAALPPPAPAPVSYEADLFGFDGPPPGTGALQDPTPGGDTGGFGGGIPDPAPAPGGGIPEPAPGGYGGMPEPAPGGFGGIPDPAPSSGGMAEPALGGFSGIPDPAPAPGGFSGIPEPSGDVFGGMMTPAPASGGYGGIPDPTQAGVPPTEEFGALSMNPSAPSIHPTSSFEDGGLMGGVGSSMDSAPASAMTAGAFGHVPTTTSTLTADDVQKMKDRALEAERSSAEAHDTFQTLAAEADKLRSAADQAESDARTKQAKANEKPKKKVFGGRGKKKELKEAEDAANDAAAKKKHFLELQTQANNAQTLAMESRREAEKLKQEAEQAELNLASAASVAEAHEKDMTATKAAMDSAPTQTNGFQEASAPAGYPSYGVEASQAPSPFGGAPSYGAAPANTFGAPPSFGAPGGSEGFGVMGGGGAGGIPSPPRASELGGDPYANPF